MGGFQYTGHEYCLPNSSQTRFFDYTPDDNGNFARRNKKPYKAYMILFLLGILRYFKLTFRILGKAD
jgi:hypothetical protein